MRRETFEESGIVVGEEVQLVGSQPWPIGAAGHSELMLGCIARATSEDITIDETEMSEVRWPVGLGLLVHTPSVPELAV